MYFEAPEKTEQELGAAQERLDAFEKATANTHRLARLRKESPAHPLLLGMSVTAVGSVLLLVLGLVMMALTLLSTDFQRTVAAMPLLNVLPPAFLVFALCGGMLWGALLGMAIQRGGTSPRLPKDQNKLNQLRSDVQRLQAAQKVSKRLSATPAPNRRVGFPGSRS